MAERALGLGAQVVDAELEHPAQPPRAAAAAVALERLLELARGGQALGERLLDGALEREGVERAGEVDDGDRGRGDRQAFEARDVARGEVDPVDSDVLAAARRSGGTMHAQRRHRDRSDLRELRRHVEPERPAGSPRLPHTPR